MKVFVSSVVRDFEQYRAAAKKAVSLLGHTPVMCEDFGARPYSSQEACMTEVDQADIVVLILGAEFGYQTSSGESVTQQEFRRAKAGGKPILAFLQELPVEGKQQDFRWEVSDYVDGLFRVTFTNEQELSDGIVRALSQMAVSREAISEQDFVRELQQRPNDSRWGIRSDETRLELAFLPQPKLAGSLRAAHMRHEAFFLKLCQAGLGELKAGYDDFDNADLTGLDTKGLVWRHHDSGMSWLSISLTNPSSAGNSFASYYISPSHVRAAALAAFELLSEGKGGWLQLGLYGVAYKVFAEPPAGSVTSMSMPHRSEQSLEARQLMIPASTGAYSRWLDDVMFRFARKLST
ncbi:DUF4062 domain-containing protein [Pseudomonas veronii]|uniref:DUF4062 domain-containing protein n=1 Tax=Pseudomonas veronii TaxID=76761 RepID=UPI0009A492FC|nr:DUF4062 domain-containing protein [Pseudomonas veronii]AQY65706.1 DUF4062 domain-containing protein [Pseudomonas veronii]